ncbi:hypothetical protein Tco_0412746 [Tanacetum coccineum]
MGHKHKFITEIVARRANECIVSITEPDYKNLNKNDTEDMYLLIMNGKVPDYAKTMLLWSLAVFIRRVEKHRMFSIIYEPVHGIIYKNSKKEKRVMRHSEIHKFCDATLNRVLEGLKSYNNDVKYGYVQRELTNNEVKYLKLFEDEIEGVGAEVEHSKPGFELQGAKMVETGQNRDFRLRTARVTTPGLRFLVSFASFLYLRLLKIT